MLLLKENKGEMYMKLNLKNGKLTIFKGILLINSNLVLTGCSNKNYDNKNVQIIETTVNSDVNVTIDSDDSAISEATYEETNKDEIVLKYYQDEETKIKRLLNSNDKDMKQKVSETVVTLVDFLFYDGEIKGITRTDISDETKNKLMNIIEKVDTKIEKRFPDYKEKISDKTSDALNFIKEKGTNGIHKLDDYLNQKVDNYDEFKDVANSIISNTKDDFNEVKDLAKSGFSKVKDYYENWREDVKNNE